ncbi:TIGR00282 family metallophosphoesterase [Risungbinella massiliensis]|uniref:TIGR00282 family metallophosphoesterase n=1 Tax=Risungbinella massiliensis TaxID=1329796 RepID=UPI0005CB8401|nr:TIGR00282 family metallophosphoesterase [Risungbinella massiliensis]
MKLLMIGDVVGTTGRQVLQQTLPELKKTYQPDVIVVNGENSAPNGRGITQAIVREYWDLGVHVITLGNHAWDQGEIFDFIDREKRIIRPANFPVGTPGNGSTTISTPKGKITILNLIGRTFLGTFDCPFRKVDELLQKVPSSHYVFLDFHAEATAEKLSMGWYLDGKISAMVGTHTHVQTGDDRILPKGTGYLTDVGMVGAYDGILGMEKDAVIRRFLTQLPVRFEVTQGRTQFNAVLFHFSPETKRTTKIQRIRIDDDKPWFS